MLSSRQPARIQRLRHAPGISEYVIERKPDLETLMAESHIDAKEGVIAGIHSEAEAGATLQVPAS
jgi:hypothetical protein